MRAFTAGRDVDIPSTVVQPHQTHSTNVAYVDRPDLTREDLEGVDALVTDLMDVAIGVRTADCVPVLLYDPVHRAIGAAHSGRRASMHMWCGLLCGFLTAALVICAVMMLFI